MQNTSAIFKTKIKEPSRLFENRITIGDKIYTKKDLIDLKLKNTLQNNSGFVIGLAPSATLELTLKNVGNINQNLQIKLEIGVEIKNNEYEYVQLGIFNIDAIEKTDNNTKITAFDNMIMLEAPYFSSLSFPANITNVIKEITSKTGVSFEGSLPNYNINKKPEALTCREMVAYIASMCAGNAVINRQGKLNIITPKKIDYEINKHNYFDPLKLEDNIYKIGKVTCKVEDKELSKGSLGPDAMEICFVNPFVTESILQDIYNKLNGFSYTGYNFKWQGDFSLDLGDIVTLVDKNNVSRNIPLLNIEYNYNGGLVSALNATGETNNKNRFDATGSNSKQINRVATELALVNKAFVDYAHINDADITNLRAKDAEIQNALIEKADVKDLKAIDADIDNLHAKDAVIDKALIGKADIIDLDAVKADINILDADVGNIKTLTAGNISAENIKVDFLQTLEGWMLEGSIGNAQISDLNANKIRSGTVDTSLVTVAGPQGRLKLQGNKLQVFDSKDNVLYERIMLGIDENNNSALVLRGTDGKTVLLNQDGLTKAGFTDGYNKIDNNSLDGSKLDINSVVRKVNGSTEKIESTVVQAGDKTLNILLQEQNNNITEHGKSLSTHESRITANEKSINLKVDSQTYTADKTTINKSIETTLANSKAYVNQEITTVNSNLSKATSEISVLKGQISLKVEQGDIDKTVTTVKNELDSKIADVTTTTDTKINTAKSEIKAETDKIKLSVTGLDSKTKTIETQLGDKATKTEVKTVSDKAASIEANLGGITQRVSSTESNIKTHNTQLGEVDGKINKAKSDAITTASSDATNKANQALIDSKGYTNGQITTVNKTVTDKFSEIKAATDSITSKVSNVEATTTTLNGKVASQETRLKTAEQKMTDSSIISTVKNAKTDGKATFATTSTVEQLNDQVNFKFDSLGVTNVLSNSNFANRDCTGWTLIDIYTYDPNPEVFMPYEGWRAFNMIGGENRGLLAQPDIKKDRIPQRNTKYTFSLSSITEGNIEYIGLYLDYKLNGRYVYNQQIPLKTGANYNRYSISFTTPNGDYDYFMFYIETKRKSGTSGYTVFSIGLPCLSRGDNTSYTARENEVVSGNTKIDANGVEIYNGALAVKNKAGNKVIEADSNGDITLRGRLQPNDNKVRLFGENCKVEGGSGAIRLAYDNVRYISVGADNSMVMYTANTPPSGNKYFYIKENNDSHTSISNTRTLLKLLGGPVACVQSRWGGDTAYAAMAASEWQTGSSKHTKTNITPANTDNLVKMIKDNVVKNYQLKAELMHTGYDEKKTLLASDVAMKTGLVIEELTPEARYMLTPNNADTIDLYSMVSTLWAGTQSCINKIEQQQEQIDRLQRQIDELKSLVIKN